MEGYQVNYNSTDTAFHIDTYCYCDDEIDDAYCVIVDVIEDGEKYKIIDFQEQRERIVVKSSLRTIYDQQIIDIAKLQENEYITKQYTQNHEKKDWKTVPFTDTDNEMVEFLLKKKDEQKLQNIPFTDPENKLVEFPIKKGCECIVLSIIASFGVLVGISMCTYGVVGGVLNEALVGMIIMLGFGGLLTVVFCIMCWSSYHTKEKIFIFDYNDRKILCKTRYWILCGYSRTMTYGNFADFLSIEFEVKKGNDELRYYVVWSFIDGLRTVESDKHGGEKVVNKIQYFLQSVQFMNMRD